MNKDCLFQAPDGGSQAGCWRLLGELVVADLRSLELGPRLVCETVARDGMRKVAAAIGEYPEPVQVILIAYWSALTPILNTDR